MTFAEALTAALNGSSILRDGWNGKGLTVSVQRPDSRSYMTQPYTYIQYPDGSRTPWVPSQGDLFAEDWRTA